MVTTGATPMIAVIKEELKNHPEKALQMGITGMTPVVLSTPLCCLALTGLQNKTMIQSMVQSQYFSSIESAVCSQRNLDQMRDANGNE
jgi:hypothetical protein